MESTGADEASGRWCKGLMPVAARAGGGQVVVRGEKRSSLRTDRCITQVYIHVGGCPKVVRA